MSDYPSLERSERAESILLISTALLVILSSILTLALMILPIVVFRGFLLDGYISLLRYDLTVAYVKREIPPLESVVMISRAVLLIVLVALVSLALALVERRGVRERVSLISLIASLAQVSLTYSLLRVVVRDIIPRLPATGYATYSSAGFIMIYPPETLYGFPHDFFVRQGYLVIILLLALFTVLILYMRYLYLKSARRGG